MNEFIHNLQERFRPPRRIGEGIGYQFHRVGGALQIDHPNGRVVTIERYQKETPDKSKKIVTELRLSRRNRDGSCTEVGRVVYEEGDDSLRTIEKIKKPLPLVKKIKAEIDGLDPTIIYTDSNWSYGKTPGQLEEEKKERLGLFQASLAQIIEVLQKPTHSS